MPMTGYHPRRRPSRWLTLSLLLCLFATPLVAPAQAQTTYTHTLPAAAGSPSALADDLQPGDVKQLKDYDASAAWIYDVLVTDPRNPMHQKEVKAFELLPGLVVVPERYMFGPEGGKAKDTYLRPMEGMNTTQLRAAKTARVRYVNIIGSLMKESLRHPTGRALLSQFGKIKPLPDSIEGNIREFSDGRGPFWTPGRGRSGSVTTVITGPANGRGESFQISLNLDGTRPDLHTSGRGAGGLVSFDPFFLPEYNGGASVIPPQIGLEHELTHSLHGLAGVITMEPVDHPTAPYKKGKKTKIAKEEILTTGGDEYRKLLNRKKKIPEYVAVQEKWKELIKGYDRLLGVEAITEAEHASLLEQVEHRKKMLDLDDVLTEVRYMYDLGNERNSGLDWSRGNYTNAGPNFLYAERPEDIAGSERPWDAANYKRLGGEVPKCDGKRSIYCMAEIVDGYVDPPKQQQREEAEAAGKKWRSSSRDRTKDLCANRGKASCLETVNWEELRTEIRSDAEKLVNKKLESVGTMHDIKLTEDLGTSLKDPWSFYIPYEKTRAKLAGPAGKLAWERVKSAGGGALYLYGIYEAFKGDSTTLDKAAAISAIIPGVGDLLNLGVDVERKDWAGLGIDAAATAAGFLEMAGVAEGLGGPAFALAMVDHLLLQTWYAEVQNQKEIAHAVENRDAAWHKALINYLQDPEKGWLSKDGGDQIVAMAVGFLQAVELQRASVKATAHAASVADNGGAYLDPKTSDWASTKESKDADAAADKIVDKTPDIIREAAAKAMAKGMNAAWKEKQGQDFNKPWVDRVESLNIGIWCGRSGPDGQNPCHKNSQEMKQEALQKLKNDSPAGVTPKEVEDILENFGLTDPGFLPVGKPFRLANEADGAKRYLHFDVENGNADRKKGDNDPARQEFYFRTTGRISDLEGELCLAGGKNTGDHVTVTGCTHRNAPEQRWEPDNSGPGKDAGRIKNYATGQYLDVGGPDGYVTTWTGDGNRARQTWKTETPPRSMTAQNTNDTIKKLISAPGSSNQVDGIVPDPNRNNGYWIFSGSNYVLADATSSPDGKLKLSIPEWAAVWKTHEKWESLVPLLTASRDARISAGMKIPGHPNELYVFSGDKYARIAIDKETGKDRLINEARDTEANWPSLKGLFEKSGTKRIDAVRPIPGQDCFQMFSGSYSNQICLDNNFNDRQTRPVQRNAERWPEIGANTGTDRPQGFIQVPGKPMANHIFATDQYTYVDRSELAEKPDVQFEAHASWVYFTFSWKNGNSLPESAKIVVKLSGDVNHEAEFNPADGHLDTNKDKNAQALLYRYPVDLVGSKSYTLQAHYRYVHPDGSVEETPQWTQSYWCSFWECDMT